MNKTPEPKCLHATPCVSWEACARRIGEDADKRVGAVIRKYEERSWILEQLEPALLRGELSACFASDDDEKKAKSFLARGQREGGDR